MGVSAAVVGYDGSSKKLNFESLSQENSLYWDDILGWVIKRKCGKVVDSSRGGLIKF